MKIKTNLCAALKLLLLVFLGGDRVRNLLRDTLLPVLVLTIHYRARRPIGFLKVKILPMLVLTMQRLNRVSMPQAHKGFQNQLKRTFKVKYKRMLFQAPKCYSTDQLTMSWNNYSGSDLHESYLKQFRGVLMVDDEVADLSI